MSTLHPKFSVSIYSEDVKFSEQPYDQSGKFAVYTVDHETVAKNFSSKHGTGANFYKIKSSNASPIYKSSKVAESSAREPAQVDSPSLAQSQTFGFNASKLKSKLTQDVEKANYYDAQADEEYERHSNNFKRSSTARSSLNDQLSQGSRQPYSLVTSPQPMRKGNQSIVFSAGRSPNSTKIKTGTANSFLKMRTKTSALQKTLYYDPRISSIPKTTTKNEVIDDLLKFEDTIMNNPVLLDSVVKLRDMHLLKKNQPGVNKFKGVGKVDHVYNDFHSRSTNPGFSRNSGGVPYFR